MIGKKYLPTRASKLKCLLLLGFMISIYSIDNILEASFTGSQIFIYGIKPILWGGLALLIWYLPKVEPKGKLKLRSFLNLWAFNLSIIYIAVSIIAGMVDGFGKSPYNHNALGILTNIISTGALLIGTEFMRNYLICSLTKKENYLVFIIISLLITMTTISLNRFTNLKEFQEIVEFIARYFAPEFSKNLLACHLAFLGGPLPAIIYMGILQGFHWLSPILPNLRWITAALVGVLCPLFSLMALQSIYSSEAKLVKKRDQEEESLKSWMITSLISIGIIWFAVGVFPVYPSVIATGSMEPMIYPGDVILVQKIADIEGINQLQIGDVIQFRRNSIFITHRIIEISKDKEGIISFETKGDNNTGPDIELVKPEQIKGTIIKVVPKVGWPTLLLKQRKDVTVEYIEF